MTSFPIITDSVSSSCQPTPQWQTFPVDRILMQRMRLASVPDKVAIDAWQMECLRETLRHARACSPFYAARFSDADMDGLYSRKDLALLPRITADDIRTFGLDMVCVSQDEVARVVTLDTSGTSGSPKRLFFSQEDLDRTAEFFTIGMQAVACPEDTVLALLPDERPSSVGRLLAQSVIDMGAKPVPGSITRGGEALAAMAVDMRVAVIVGSPLHLRTFALGWRALGFPKGIIHTVLLCWDAIPQAVIDLLHAILGCRVLIHWGMTETGLGGALSCAEQRGMHVREADLLVEVTDPATGHLLPDGEWGEIVLTTLCRKAMPLIRYRTGDRGRILPEPCDCGSPQRRLDRSPGRLQDDIILPGGNDLRLIDLDESLLPLYDIVDYVARWYDTAMASAQGMKALPLLDITVYAPRAESFCRVREEAIRNLCATPPLAACIAQQQIRLNVSASCEADRSMDYTKRRILRESAAPSGTENSDKDTP